MLVYLSNEQINIIYMAERRNIPLSELSKKTGHGASYFYGARYTLSEDTLSRAASVLGVTIADLRAEPAVDINCISGCVALLTRLRKACNLLYISAKRFYFLTGINIEKAYVRKIPMKKISKAARLLGVSKEYLLRGACEEAEENRLQENKAYLTWKLSGYNTGEERDLIFALAKDARITVYELKKLFALNGLPSYLLRTSSKKSPRLNMTDTERKKIASLLNVSEKKLKEIQWKEVNSGERLAAHYINKDYPSNLLADIEKQFSAVKVTDKELEFFLYFLTPKQAYYISERYEHHKTITKIAEECHVSKQAVDDSIKRGITRMVDRIAEQYPNSLIKEPVYPDNVMKVLHKHTAMDGVPISIESVEKVVTRLSIEEQEMYRELFINGKTVAMLQKERNLPATERKKLHEKRHELIVRIIRKLIKLAVMP